ALVPQNHDVADVVGRVHLRAPLPWVCDVCAACGKRATLRDDCATCTEDERHASRTRPYDAARSGHARAHWASDRAGGSGFTLDARASISFKEKRGSWYEFLP